MKIEDAFGFEKLKKIGANDDAEGSKYTEGIGVGSLEVGGLLEVSGGTGMKKDVGVLLKLLQCKVGERAVAEEDDLRPS